MDIDVKEFSKSSIQLFEIYTSLTGKTRIQEPFGHKQYIEFEADGMDHISVCGEIWGETVFSQVLYFENMVDQTVFKDFSKQLKDNYSTCLE